MDWLMFVYPLLASFAGSLCAAAGQRLNWWGDTGRGFWIQFAGSLLWLSSFQLGPRSASTLVFFAAGSAAASTVAARLESVALIRRPPYIEVRWRLNRKDVHRA